MGRAQAPDSRSRRRGAARPVSAARRPADGTRLRVGGRHRRRLRARGPGSPRRARRRLQRRDRHADHGGRGGRDRSQRSGRRGDASLGEHGRALVGHGLLGGRQLQDPADAELAPDARIPRGVRGARLMVPREARAPVLLRHRARMTVARAVRTPGLPER